MERSEVLAFTQRSTEAFRLIEGLLHLFAFFFPKQAILKDNASYDFVIVGAGSAGCVLASRLTEDPNVSVLLIEAGDNPTMEVMMAGTLGFSEFTKFDWNYTTVNDGKAFQCHEGHVYPAARGHGLGGSSSINYMMYIRGDPHDYNQWAKISNDSAWDYNNVLPYFKKSERLEDPILLQSSHKKFHGTKGPIGVTTYRDPLKQKYLEALQEIGHKLVLDNNGDNTLGFTNQFYTAAGGLRQSTCYCFISPVKDRKNLSVLRNTKVNKVIFQGNVAVGVEAVTENNVKITIKAKREVILSAGAFNTPQLLMLSGVGPREHLKSFNIKTINDLPVGYNLQDHIAVVIAHQTEPLNSSDILLNPLRPALFLNGFVALDKSQKFPDVQYIMHSTRTTPIVRDFQSMYDDIYSKLAKATVGKEVLVNFMLDLRPVSRGRIMLGSANPNDPPKIYLGAYSNDTDVDHMVAYIEDYLRIEKSAYFKTVNASRIDLAGNRCKGFPIDSKAYWKCYSKCLMFSIYHYCGTCSMGTVVDSRLRVLGMKKLRVVDASVFPTVPSGNTNAPTIMTAEKAADIIKTDHNMEVEILED